MSLHVATDGLHVYDDQHDCWHRFETVDEVQSFLHSYSEPDIEGESYERVRSEVADNFSTVQYALDGTVSGGLVPVLAAPADPQRRFIRIGCTTAAAAGNGVLVGTFSELSAAGNVGFLLTNGQIQDFPVTAPIYIRPTAAAGIVASIMSVRD